MVGDKLRITDQDGHTMTATITRNDDASEITIAGKRNLMVETTIRHRPIWPSMANERKIYLDDAYQWWSSTGQPITVETLEPAPKPGPQLVVRP